MVTEIATITVAPGREADFAGAMSWGGLAALSACPGVQAVRFGPGVENPSSFAFVVEWDSLEAHATAKETDAFATFRAAFGDCAIGGTMQHYHFA